MAELPDLRGAKLIGLDTETHDPALQELGPGFIRGDAHVIGFSVAVPGWSTYVPLHHYSGNVDNPEQAKRWLADCLKSYDSVILGANIHYDLDALWAAGIKVNGKLWDVQVVDSIIDETLNSYSLENIAQRRLGEGKKNLELKQTLANMKATMSDLRKLESSYVAEYGERDASLLLEIYQSQLADIQLLNLGAAIERENRLTRTLWNMHQQGVRVNVDKVVQLNEKWLGQANDYLNEARRLAGWRFNPNSPKHLAGLLDARGISYNLTAKGNPTISNEFLESIDDPICALITNYRRLNKIRKDYCEGVFLKYLVGDRIYPQWFQSRNSKKDEDDAHGATTGRITGSKPNLTQIPARSDLGKELRSVVEAEQGETYVKLDYSSQEPRISLHFAVKAKCSGAAEARQRFLDDKRTDYHQMTKDLIFEKAGVVVDRREAKDCNLGLTYGMQFRRLAQKLGLDEPSARTLLAAYHKGVPYVQEITELAQKQAAKMGYVRTIGGRLRRFNEWGIYGAKTTYRTKEEAMKAYGQAELLGMHKAFNAAVQGSAADQMKQSLIMLEDAGQLPLLQVYDECGLSVGSTKQIDEAVEIMEHSFELEVPSLVEPAVGRSWGEAK